MSRKLRFAAVVFTAAFLTNVIVVAMWPDSSVDLATAAVIGLATSAVLTWIEHRPRRSGRHRT
ncbi:MAG: hypothetical protein OEO77_02490 [Acidimicrobiia bacterium]|nr:hypothetical protein [Acidimicrobiia bacterium]